MWRPDRGDIRESNPQLLTISQHQGEGPEACDDIFELYDHEPSRFKDFKNANRTAYDEAYRLYKLADFLGAKGIYDELLRKAGSHSYEAGLSADPVLDYYALRCSDLVKASSAGLVSMKDWDGVHTFIA